MQCFSSIIIPKIVAVGIVAFGDGFLIALFHTGGLYYVEPANGVSEEVIPLGDLTLADGLELVTEEDGSETLYITEGANQLSVFKIEAGSPAPAATLLGTLMSDLYDTPATSAVIGDMIYTTNLREATVSLNSPDENNTDVFTETFGVVGVSRFVVEDGMNTPTPAAAPTALSPTTSAAVSTAVSCFLTGFLLAFTTKYTLYENLI